jgi:hypothetical protein
MATLTQLLLTALIVASIAARNELRRSIVNAIAFAAVAPPLEHSMRCGAFLALCVELLTACAVLGSRSLHDSIPGLLTGMFSVAAARSLEVRVAGHTLSGTALHAAPLALALLNGRGGVGGMGLACMCVGFLHCILERRLAQLYT